MTNSEAVNWLINITADIGKTEHQELWHYEQALTEIREMLETEPQRMRGRWIEPTEDNDYWECPVCHDTYELDVDVTPQDVRLFFCPNCGADMRKEQEC